MKITIAICLLTATAFGANLSVRTTDFCTSGYGSNSISLLCVTPATEVNPGLTNLIADASGNALFTSMPAGIYTLGIGVPGVPSLTVTIPTGESTVYAGELSNWQLTRSLYYSDRLWLHSNATNFVADLAALATWATVSTNVNFLYAIGKPATGYARSEFTFYADENGPYLLTFPNAWRGVSQPVELPASTTVKFFVNWFSTNNVFCRVLE